LDNRLSGLGHPADALAAEREATEIRLTLAAADLGRYLPDLAQSLSNIGITYTEFGRRAEALPVAMEAVEIRCGLGAAKPEHYLPDLVSSLRNLDITLYGLSRSGDALPLTRIRE
jgi:hypothetical protein